jgi:hypothetical protein
MYGQATAAQLMLAAINPGVVKRAADKMDAATLADYVQGRMQQRNMWYEQSQQRARAQNRGRDLHGRLANADRAEGDRMRRSQAGAHAADARDNADMAEGNRMRRNQVGERAWESRGTRPSGAERRDQGAMKGPRLGDNDMSQIDRMNRAPRLDLLQPDDNDMGTIARLQRYAEKPGPSVLDSLMGAVKDTPWQAGAGAAGGAGLGYMLGQGLDLPWYARAGLAGLGGVGGYYGGKHIAG